MSDIFLRWPASIAQRLATFTWPLTSRAEVHRLVHDDHIQIWDLVLFEYTAEVRERHQLWHGAPVLSVDLRSSLVPGIHACIDVRLVLTTRPRFRYVYGFPPCTHQTLSDTRGRAAKELDGRMFWGLLCVIYCWCISAEMIDIEQPDTHLPKFITLPSQRFRTGQMGDDIDKCINLYRRGRQRLQPVREAGGISGHGVFANFRDADERDRHRSSWARFPRTALALVAAPRDPLNSVVTPSFDELREEFAVAWYREGLPVPEDYDTDDAQPASDEGRRYQFVRGQGDGRRFVGVVPRSLRHSNGSAESLHFAALTLRFVALSALETTGFMLCFVSMQFVPLIFAPLNGFEVVGAQLRLSSHRKFALTIATRWANEATNTLSSTFTVGSYEGGALLCVSPVDLRPPRHQVVRTAADRRLRCRAGVAFGWCTIAALAGTAMYDPAARAVAACSALRCPLQHRSAAARLGHRDVASFSVGVFKSVPMVDRFFDLPTDSLAASEALEGMHTHAQALLARLRSQGDDESLLWAGVIRPEELQDVPPGFFHTLPTFDDDRLDQLLLTPPHVPLPLPRLLPKPLQPTREGYCPLTPHDLMFPATQLRFANWMRGMLADLVCMRDFGVDCARDRPGILVIAQTELYDWARGIIWDFRRSPERCATPLDFGLPLEPTLNVAFFQEALRHYPNQRILGMIESGVVYQADVELHAVFLPHLVSLPKGFKAVHKELKRLSAKGWYETYAHPAFFPGYYNAQGSTARKLEPDRDRRTEDGSAPHKEIRDRDGLRVLPINEAAKIYHLPRHLASDNRPEMLAWLQSRGLPATQQQVEDLARTRGSKWGGSQYMPTIRMIMHDLSGLSRAARRLGRAVYVFGNDVKDFFNHLENAVTELPIMNLAWIGDDELEADAQRRAYSDAQGNRLVFVSERRMGFGMHPNSVIAQELSESIDYIYRQRLDAVLDPRHQTDPDPRMQSWLAERHALERRHGGHQSRLYAVHTYCDDNIVIVVGVDDALTALAERTRLEQDAGLIMAIPEKRMLGTWGMWLGIYIFAGLGLVVVPRSKLARASLSLREAAAGTLQFDDYRALMGLLEHIRHASCWPRSMMYGLYRPHGPEGESRFGPSALVKPTLLMTKQLTRWLDQLAHAAGAVVTDVLRRSTLHRPRGQLRYVATSDAATDSQPPGMGGFMHGLYWYLPLDPVHVRHLHISVLEMLATGFSTIIFRRALAPSTELDLGTDASATATTLTLHSAHREMLMQTHRALLDDAEYSVAQRHTNLGHVSGDSNEASDAVSRAKWSTFFSLCQRVRVRATQLSVPNRCLGILQQLLDTAASQGRVVRENPYRAVPPVVPTEYRRLLTPDERMLGKRHRSNEDGDGPQGAGSKGTTLELPLEVWAAVFSFFTDVKMQFHYAQVCRTFSDACLDRRRAIAILFVALPVRLRSVWTVSGRRYRPIYDDGIFRRPERCYTHAEIESFAFRGRLIVMPETPVGRILRLIDSELAIYACAASMAQFGRELDFDFRPRAICPFLNCNDKFKMTDPFCQVYWGGHWLSELCSTCRHPRRYLQTPLFVHPWLQRPNPYVRERFSDASLDSRQLELLEMFLGRSHRSNTDGDGPPKEGLWAALPEELWRHVFVTLSPSGYFRCACVCRLLKEAADRRLTAIRVPVIVRPVPLDEVPLGETETQYIPRLSFLDPFYLHPMSRYTFTFFNYRTYITIWPDTPCGDVARLLDGLPTLRHCVDALGHPMLQYALQHLEIAALSPQLRPCHPSQPFNAIGGTRRVEVMPSLAEAADTMRVPSRAFKVPLVVTPWIHDLPEDVVPNRRQLEMLERFLGRQHRSNSEGDGPPVLTDVLPLELLVHVTTFVEPAELFKIACVARALADATVRRRNVVKVPIFFSAMPSHIVDNRRQPHRLINSMRAAYRVLRLPVNDAFDPHCHLLVEPHTTVGQLTSLVEKEPRLMAMGFDGAVANNHFHTMLALGFQLAAVIVPLRDCDPHTPLSEVVDRHQGNEERLVDFWATCAQPVPPLLHPNEPHLTAPRRMLPLYAYPWVKSPRVWPVVPPRHLTMVEMFLGASRRNNTDADGPSRYAEAKAMARPLRPSLTSASGTCELRQPSRYKAAATSGELPGAAAPRTNLPDSTADARPLSLYRQAVSGQKRRVEREGNPEERKRSAAVRMPTVTIDGHRFAAPAGRQERATSQRKSHMLQLAHERARAMGNPEASSEVQASLTKAVLATHELAEYGAAFGTLDKDDLAWQFWTRFCTLYGWSPTFDGDAEWMRLHAHEISQRLAIFQSWVYPQLSGRGGRSDAKPRTVFDSYVLAVIRTLSREHLPMPKAKHVEKSLAGLSRSFKNIYGVEQLMPGRKQPFTPTMWRKVENLPENAHLPGRAPWSPATRLRDRTLLRLGRVLWRCGHRLGEIVWHKSGEINYLTRKSVTIRKASGRCISAPSAQDWRELSSQDVILLAPCASKPDQFGEEHCPFPSILPCDGSSRSAAFAIRDIELEQPCAPEDRWCTPLFCDEAMQPFTYSVLHAELRRLLTALYDAAFAKAFSWHSIRIGLACALHAADCPDAVIQLICRWASPDSLKVYRQVGIEKNIHWTEKAQQVTFDATRVNNIPALDNAAAHQRNLQTFDDTHVAATVAREATPAAVARSYAVPGGTVLAIQEDPNGLVGLDVNVYNNLWPGYENSFGRTSCPVVARCQREFRHPDGARCLTYLITYGGIYYPIKHQGLLDCLRQDVRRSLPQQRGL